MFSGLIFYFIILVVKLLDVFEKKLSYSSQLESREHYPAWLLVWLKRKSSLAMILLSEIRAGLKELAKKGSSRYNLPSLHW